MTVKDYLAKLPGTDEFLATEGTVQDRWIFQATESLKDHLHPRQITDRVIALQTLYLFTDESQDFGVLKRQGVDTYSAEGLSVSFKSGVISPDVLAIVQKSGRAGVGSLI